MAESEQAAKQAKLRKRRRRAFAGIAAAATLWVFSSLPFFRGGMTEKEYSRLEEKIDAAISKPELLERFGPIFTVVLENPKKPKEIAIGFAVARTVVLDSNHAALVERLNEILKAEKIDARVSAAKPAMLEFLNARTVGSFVPLKGEKWKANLRELIRQNWGREAPYIQLPYRVKPELFTPFPIKSLKQEPAYMTRVQRPQRKPHRVQHRV